jgi:hypothetical protein
VDLEWIFVLITRDMGIMFLERPTRRGGERGRYL